MELLCAHIAHKAEHISTLSLRKLCPFSPFFCLSSTLSATFYTSKTRKWRDECPQQTPFRWSKSVAIGKQRANFRNPKRQSSSRADPTSNPITSISTPKPGEGQLFFQPHPTHFELITLILTVAGNMVKSTKIEALKREKYIIGTGM